MSELVPHLRGQAAVRRYPVVLAVIARHVADGAVQGARGTATAPSSAP